MALGEFFLGTPGQERQFPRFGPQQQQLQNQAITQALSMLQQPQQQFDFAPIEQRARTQFQQQTVPTIAERFESMGGLRSGAFRRSLGQAGAGLEEGLAALRSQYGLQQQGQQQNLLQNLLGLGLQPQFESTYMPRQPGFLENLLGPLLGGIGQGIGYGAPSYIQGYFSQPQQQQQQPGAAQLLQLLGLLQQTKAARGI